MRELTKNEQVICAASALDIPSLDREGRKKVIGDLWDAAYAAGAVAQGTYARDTERLARARAGLDPDAENGDYVQGVLDGIEEERTRWRALIALLPADMHALLAPFTESLWEAAPRSAREGKW